MTKITLSLSPLNGGAFRCLPAREIELAPERIICNDIILPWETNYHHVRLWVIGNEYGALGAVWAAYEQDALDELIDQNLGAALLIDEEDQKTATPEEQEDWARLGNASEPCDLTNVWIQPVRLDRAKDCELLCRFAEARGDGSSNLDT